MELESLRPFILIIAQTLGFVFLTEAVTIYFFKLKPFWPAVGIAIVVNLLAFVVLYGGAMLTGKLGYEFNGLQLPLQVMLFLWWLSVLTDGLLLQLFVRHADKQRLFLTSVVMNTLSYLFLYFFVINSQ